MPVAPWTSAASAVVIDGWTGNVLYAKNPDVMRAPASTVKIMTALVVLHHHLRLRHVVSVPPLAVTYGGSTAGLYSGELLSVRNLLYAMLLPSGNDAAVTLAIAEAGSVPAFVAQMNREAVRLHLWHTHYLTPNGFDTWGQVTSARDLAYLARAAMQFPIFARVVHSRYWSAWSADHRIYHQWTNLNKLLWSYGTVDGIKTGTTPYAGACLASSARQKGKWVISVNLGSTVAARFSDGASLLNYGLQLEGAPPSA